MDIIQLGDIFLTDELSEELEYMALWPLPWPLPPIPTPDGCGSTSTR